MSEALRWTKRRDVTWGTTHVLRDGRREVLCVFFIPRESPGGDDGEDARRRKRNEWGWRAGFEGFPDNRDLHVWLGQKLTVEQAKLTAVRVFYNQCAELRTACESAMGRVLPLYSGSD